MDTPMVTLIHPLWLLAVPGVIAALIFLFIRGTIKRTTPRRRVSLLFRSLAVLTLVLLLAGLSGVGQVDKMNIVYLVDRSLSLGTESSEIILDYIQQTLSLSNDDDFSALVLFGGNSAVESKSLNEQSTIRLTSIIDQEHTNLEEGLITAISCLPDNGEKKILLFTDGNQTEGDAIKAASTAAALGIQIDIIPVRRRSSLNEAWIDSIDSPEKVRVEEQHALTIQIQSTAPTGANLVLYKDGNLYGRDEITLKPGLNTFSFSSRLDDKGIHYYDVYLEPWEDGSIENNHYRFTVQAEGPPKILYVQQEDEISRNLPDALQTQGFNIDSSTPSQMPGTLDELIAYDTIILDNVPAFNFSFSKMEALEKYVKNLGGGLLAIGGDNSFGVGGYYRTPLEKILPVDMDVTTSMEMPSLAIVMVIDKSGSMGTQTATGETKLQLVKEAVMSAVDILNPFYQVGLVAFDANHEWVFEPTDAGRKDEILEALRPVNIGGGTVLYPAMEEAYKALKEMQASIRHMLVLSDGLTKEGNFESLVHTLAAEGITLSTVAVGEDADQELMQQMAEIGGGRFYFADRADRVPRIFASESLIVSRGLIIEKPFQPMVSETSQIMKGIPTPLPAMSGFILTYKKAGAAQILTSYNNNPLLTSWQYGLGRTAAFTSDLKGKWGTQWVTWSSFPQFAGQLVHWLERPVSSGNLVFSREEVDGQMTLTIDALTDDHHFHNGLGLKGYLIQPGNREKELDFFQTAPGRYQAQSEGIQEGTYLLTVFDPEETIPPSTFAFTQGYPVEYKPMNLNSSLLEELTEATGGRILSDAGENYNPYLEYKNRHTESVDLAIPLGITAIILFFLDILFRYIRIPDILTKLRQKSNTPSYEEVTSRLAKLSAEEEEKQKRMAYWFAKEGEDKTLAARIYLAKKKQSKSKQ